MSTQKTKELLYTFRFPLVILIAILTSFILEYILQERFSARVIQLSIVLIGSLPLFFTNMKALFARKFALDYIALLAIIVGILSGQYVVAAIIVLMLSGGETLEQYGTTQAKQSLTALTDRIPNTVLVWQNNAIGEKAVIENITVGTHIFVRKGEVIPLDGMLVSEMGYTDESSLTGEPYMIEKVKGDRLRSGTVNEGDGIIIKVTKANEDSTYRKIIEMVRIAQREKAPLIRLADRYSTVFTFITILLALLAYGISHDFSRVLAVLVIATPCPLILATPIALMGGMSAAAKHRIILKKLSSIEVLSKVNAVVFDKTGTVTMGKPSITDLIITDSSYSKEELYSIAEAIERNSLHPLAKAIVESARHVHFSKKFAQNVNEKIGIGIEGTVDGKVFKLSKAIDESSMAIEMTAHARRIAIFKLEDKIKDHSVQIIKQLQGLGLELFLFTGDDETAAQRVAKQLGVNVTIRAKCTPEDKRNGIDELRKKGKITAMIGDGINDAPALAAADVGIVFSNEEQTASSEAADIVFLGGDFSSVMQVIRIAKQTVHIAYESIFVGIGLSVIGMIFSALGSIVPITGAFIQEGIDIVVIVNALRSSRLR